MAIDFENLVTRPLSRIFGDTVSLVPNTGGLPLPITGVDLTRGIEIVSPSDITVATIRPAVSIRMADLLALGLTLDHVDGGTVVVHGKVWDIKTHVKKAGAQGEGSGEVYLILMDRGD